MTHFYNHAKCGPTRGAIAGGAYLQGIGRILETLKQMGEYENTLFVFLSDNGATNQAYNITTRADGVVDTTSQTSYVGFGAEWCNTANTPFRGHKRQTYEGGSCTPFIMHWPGGISADLRGEIIHDPGHVIDLLPTFVELAGGVPPADIEGLSLVPIIETGTRGGAEAHPFIGMQYSSTLGLRMGALKIVSQNGRNWGLFDMSVDPSESTDLSADPAHAATLATLESKFDQWATRGGIGVRSYFGGGYDGGADQGDAPAPGNGGAIALSSVDASGFIINIAAASDAETPVANLEYASYWSYRGDLETVQEILAFADVEHRWSANRTSFSIPLRFKRGTQVYGYVLVRDAEENIAVYHDGSAAAIPFSGSPPVPGEITGIEVTGRDTADITWTPAGDDGAGLLYALYVDDRPLATVGEALTFGRLVTPIAEDLTSATATRLPRGESHFALIVIDADDNAALYPLAGGLPAASVDLAVGAVSTYQDYVERLGSHADLLDPHADANGNGLSNFVDYALGIDIQKPDIHSPLSLVSVNPFQVAFSGNPLLRDVSYRVIGSNTLGAQSPQDVLFDSTTDRWSQGAEGRATASTEAPGSPHYFATLKIGPLTNAQAQQNGSH